MSRFAAFVVCVCVLVGRSADDKGKERPSMLEWAKKSQARVAYGIFIYGTGRQSARDNDVFGNASSGSVGLYCSTISTHAQDNRIFGFATGIAGGCVQDTGNVTDP